MHLRWIKQPLDGTFFHKLDSWLSLKSLTQDCQSCLPRIESGHLLNRSLVWMEGFYLETFLCDVAQCDLPSLSELISHIFTVVSWIDISRFSEHLVVCFRSPARCVPDATFCYTVASLWIVAASNQGRQSGPWTTSLWSYSTSSSPYQLGQHTTTTGIWLGRKIIWPWCPGAGNAAIVRCRYVSSSICFLQLSKEQNRLEELSRQNIEQVILGYRERIRDVMEKLCAERNLVDAFPALTSGTLSCHWLVI